MGTRAAHKSSISSGIMKVVSLFTSLQVVNVLCSMIKMKFVSLWLEATGVGLFGLYSTITETLATLTDTGLRQSSVREVASERDKPSRLRRLVAVVRSWSCVSGLVGCVLVCAFSPLLAILLFDDVSQWWNFIILGFCMLVNSLSSGEHAILQGLGRFKYIARAVLAASVTGLVISIPMFRFFGHTSVILSILVYALAGLFFVRRYRYDTQGERPSVRKLKEGKDLAKIGGFIALAAFMAQMGNTVFVTWLNRYASTAEVGYFQAGNTLVIRYVGFVISAIGMEFYPRLSANISSRIRHNVFVNHEITLILTALTPLILLFLLLRHVMVWVLYTPAFEVILPFITIGIIHAIFRSTSSVVAFSIVAKGDGKTYFFVETIDALWGVILTITGYRLAGLPGVGVAYILWFLSYFIFTTVICRRRYNLCISRRTLLAIVLSLSICVCAAFAVTLLPWYVYAPLLLVPVVFYLRRLLTLLRPDNKNRKCVNSH